MIHIYPISNCFYYSYYLEALTKLGKPIKYSVDGFPHFHQHCLAFIIDDKKVYISAGDGPGFNEIGLEWCDIYAKVNIQNDSIPAEYNFKVLPVGPSFGIQYLSGFQTLLNSWVTFVKSSNRQISPRDHFANYYRQWRYRLPIQYFKPRKVDTSYIFHASTLWTKEKLTNVHRANFIEVASKTQDIRFEGGFSPGKVHLVEGFDHLIMKEKLTFSNYLEKTKRSFVVFNTPTVQGCLGWKLGEYLALGKAIISTPLENMLPSPLVHGEHIHYVGGSKESIKKAINIIQEDKTYRESLEQHARKYYKKYISPESVITRILNHPLN